MATMKPACEHPGRDGSPGHALCRNCPERGPDGKRIDLTAKAATSEAPAVQIDGAEVLDDVERFMTRFAVFPSSHAAVATVLWAAVTHAIQAFDTAPRLALLSDEPASGKSRVLDLLALISAYPEPVVDPTGPALFAVISQSMATVKAPPTLFVDEADMLFGKNGGTGNRKLLTVLNRGYQRGASILRMERGAPVRHPVFAAAGFAGLGKLPDMLQSRCVVIRMRPRRKGEACDRYIPRYHDPLGQQIGKSLGAWAASVAVDLASIEPELPPDVEDRPSQIWWPLLAAADIAGGDWPRRAREACTALVFGTGGDDSETPTQPPALQLIADMAKVWPADADRMPTADLVRGLLALPGAPWAGMWSPIVFPREMAALLESHGIKPAKIRIGDKTMQGYHRPPQLPEVAAESSAQPVPA